MDKRKDDEDHVEKKSGEGTHLQRMSNHQVSHMCHTSSYLYPRTASRGFETKHLHGAHELGPKLASNIYIEMRRKERELTATAISISIDPF